MGKMQKTSPFKSEVNDVSKSVPAAENGQLCKMAENTAVDSDRGQIRRRDLPPESSDRDDMPNARVIQAPMKTNSDTADYRNAHQKKTEKHDSKLITECDEKYTSSPGKAAVQAGTEKDGDPYKKDVSDLCSASTAVFDASASGSSGIRKSAFSRLLDWIENGDEALDQEMEATLSEELPDDGTDTQHENTEEQFLNRNKDQSIAEIKPYSENKIPKSDKIKPDCTIDKLNYKKRITWSGDFYRSGWYRSASVIVCMLVIGLLMAVVAKMPRFGGADTLVDSEVSAFYVEHTMEETGAVNIVTGIILDYRGFDTLGESHVLFIAVCAVLLMLSIKGEKDEKERLLEAAHEQYFEPRHDVILQSAARILTPLIFVFGLYIIFNGHLSPGGGFSGGAVLGAGLILYQNAFGYEKIERFFTYKTFRVVSVICLISYSCMKGYHFFTGANQLENGISAGHIGHIFSAGLLLPLNFVVGGVVACTMYALYTMFRRGEF